MKQYNISIKGKLYKYFERRLGIKKSTKGFWRTNCVYCAGHHTFGINLETYRAHCFKCGKKTDPIKLLMDIEEFSTFAEAWSFLKIQQEYSAYERLSPNKATVVHQDIELPESFKILLNGQSIMGKCARSYMKGRGFNITKLSMAGIGYCTSGEYAGYIVFPYYRKGKLVYFQGRKFMGPGPKMKNPTEEVYGVGKSSLIYNEDALFIYRKIYIMESITNCQTIGENTIGLSGKVCSQSQLARIILAPFEYAIIILDEDALDKAYELAMQLVHYKKVKVVIMPKEKDVNDLGKTKTFELSNTTPYKKYMDFFKEKNKLHGKRTEPAHQRIRSNYSASRGAS
jgi:DNA primase